MRTKRFSVFGSPIIHSFSPQVFHQLFKKNNIAWKYNRILAHSPEDIIKYIKEFELYGANITAPYKQSIIPQLDSITDDSKKINAVNTIINNYNRLFGFNTDWEGVISALKYFFFIKRKEYNLNHKSILIIGSGNASSAAIFGINKIFPESVIDIFNKNLETSKKLAERYNVNYLSQDLTSSLLEPYDIIISTVPKPKEYFADIIFPQRSILFFANYTDISFFNTLSKTHSHLIFGNDWLKDQAIAAFEYFFSNEDYCKKIILTPLQISKEYNRLKDKTIFLTGFSGAGKTYVGEKIAAQLDRPFYDLDALVSDYFIDNIAGIFRNKGERKFRDCEKKMLFRLKKKKCVVALGGGTMAEEINLKQIQKGFVIYLHSDLETSMSRIDIATRPVLANKTQIEIEELYRKRKFIYFDNSDIIMESKDNYLNRIIDEVITIFK